MGGMYSINTRSRCVYGSPMHCGSCSIHPRVSIWSKLMHSQTCGDGGLPVLLLPTRAEQISMENSCVRCREMAHLCEAWKGDVMKYEVRPRMKSFSDRALGLEENQHSKGCGCSAANKSRERTERALIPALVVLEEQGDQKKQMQRNPNGVEEPKKQARAGTVRSRT